MQCCFLPSLPCVRKYEKPVGCDRLAGLPTCSCTWLKLSWCCLSSQYLCLLTAVFLNMFILLLMAILCVGHMEEGKESQRLFLSFLRKRPLCSSACFAGLRSKSLNASFFFFFSLLTTLQSLSLSFCPHTQWAICRKLNSFHRKKIKPIIWWTLLSTKKDNLVIVCPLPSLLLTQLYPLKFFTAEENEKNYLSQKHPFFIFVFFFFFILNPTWSCNSTPGEAAGRERRAAER